MVARDWEEEGEFLFNGDSDSVLQAQKNFEDGWQRWYTIWMATELELKMVSMFCLMSSVFYQIFLSKAFLSHSSEFHPPQPSQAFMTHSPILSLFGSIKLLSLPDFLPISSKNAEVENPLPFSLLLLSSLSLQRIFCVYKIWF